MTRLQIRLFGTPSITLAGEREAGLRSDKAVALLAYLAVESDQAHRREKLAGLLWPDYTEPSARTNLRRGLADLRQAIGDHQAVPPYLQITRDAIQLNRASDAWVDAVAFRALLEAGSLSRQSGSTISPATIDRLESAVELYRAPFLEGFSIPDSAAFEEWRLLTREQLHRQVRQALYLLAEAHRDRGEHEAALQYAWRQVEMDPWQEDAHRQVMQLLALSGQRGAALAQYEACRKLLAADLGAEPSEQTRQLYELLRHGEQPHGARVPEDRAVGSCPYRGLTAFGEEDAPFFFGREDFAARLAAAVRQLGSATVIVGASGSGKSSVVSAGLLPRLSEDGDWLVAQLRPGGQPFHALAAGLLPWLERGLSEADQLLETGKLAEALRAGKLALRDVGARALVRHPQARRLLLVVDQLEELYTLCPDPTMQEAFLDGLLGAADNGAARDLSGLPRPDRSASCALLLTLRADFVAQALAHRPFADALQSGALMLGPMTRAELRAVIEKPAEKQDAWFEPGLVDRILDNVGEEPGNLPLLEFGLTLLWEARSDGRLTHAAYEEIGQVEGALACYAEDVFGELEPDDRERAQQVFVQLVRPGEGTEDTRRLATRGEIGEQKWPLVCRLAEKRLVVIGRQAGTGHETAEVAHEALIQRWERLRRWMEADRVFRSWQEGLRAALRQWEASGRDEGALLHGAPLAAAESWLADRGCELSAAEREFIQAGEAHHERQEVEREARRGRERSTERRARRLLAALAGVLAVAVFASLGLTAFSLSQRRQALQAYSLSQAANAQAALDDLDTVQGLVLALAANRIADPPREAQRVLLDAAYAPGPRWRSDVAALFPGVQGPARSLEISPDGSTALIGMEDGTIVLWDIASKEEVLRLHGHTAAVNDVTFSADGTTGLSGGDDALVILWDLRAGHELRRYHGHAGVVRAVDFRPDGRTAVSGGFGGESLMAPGDLILWDLATGREIRRFVGHEAGVVAAEFTPDGSALLASSGDAKLFSDTVPGATGQAQGPGLIGVHMLLWDVTTGQVRSRFEDFENDVYRIAFSPDGTQALAGSFYSGVSVVWDLHDGEKLRTLTGHREGVSAVAWSRDRRRALSGSYDDSLILWDMTSGQDLARLDAHCSDVLAVALSPDGRTAISSAADGGLILWDVVDASEMARLVGHGDMVWDVAVPDGDHVLSASGSPSPNAPSKDTSIRLWDLETGAQIRFSELPADVIFQVAVSPDGRTALVATSEPFIRIWDLVAWQETGRLEGHSGPATGVEFTPDGRRALSSSVDGTLIVWDVPGRQALHRLDGHGPGLWSLAISPDGRTALSDSGDSSMLLWDLETGAELRSFVRADPAAEFGSSGMAYLPGGRTAISCEQDGTLIEWDAETGEEVRRLGQHASLRTRIVISPDGRLAVTSGMDGALMLWDLEAGELVRRTEGHGILFDLALAGDGRSILAGSSDTTILRWRLGNPSPRALQEWIRSNRYVRDRACGE